MSPPLVSVLVPSYNAGAWLAQALESALAQTWRPLEVIVVDDGSTDDSAAVAARFAARGARVLRQQNRGAAAARNAALREARGDYIQYLDADDVLAPAKIETQVRALENGPATSIATCAWGRFSQQPADATFRPEPIWRNLRGLEFLVECALGEFMFPPLAWLVPRPVCDAAGWWDERLSLNDDGEYFARVAAQSGGIVFCDSARVYYRSGVATSYGSRFSIDSARSDLRAWDAIAAVMLRLDDCPRVHLAIATGYQRLQARYYGHFPDVVAEAARLERAYGEGAYRFEGGAAFRAARSLFGWRAALRLRALKQAALQRGPRDAAGR